MTNFERVKDIVGKFSFGTLPIKVEEVVERPYGEVQVLLTMPVYMKPDNNLAPLYFATSFSEFETDGQVKIRFRDDVISFWNHELDEQLYFDGKLIKNPHKEIV